MTATDLNTFVVEGGHTLSGTITTNSSKNGAVALIAASLLNKGTTILEDMPKIEEVYRLIEVLTSIGVICVWSDRELSITPPKEFSLETLDTAAAIRTRSILMFIGPLLHHFASFAIPQSGGCTLGERSVRAHLWALEKFGVSIETLHDSFSISHDGLSPADIVLYESSDTATINSLLAASLIPGTTTIKYASANYQVQEVCGYLQKLGVDIQGLGTTTLTITGVSEINKDIRYAVAEDPVDAMFFIAAAASTHSSLTIRRVPIDFLDVELVVLEKMGLIFHTENETVAKNGITKLVDLHIEASTLTAFPEKIHPRPYPGLNIDCLPFFAVIATQAEGTTLIHDWVFEHRAIYYMELEKLGAQVLLLDPHRVQVTGPRHLRGAELMCPQALRPATVLLIGMLAAEGTSKLRNIYMIKRGYEDLVLRLQSIGATIEAVHG